MFKAILAIALLVGFVVLVYKGFKRKSKSQQVEDKPWTGPDYGGSDSKNKAP